MNYKIQESTIRKSHFIDDLSTKIEFNEKSEFVFNDNFILYHLLTNGQVVYINNKLNYDVLKTDLLEWLNKTKSFLTETKTLGSVYLIKFKEKKSIKNVFGLSGENNLYITLFENQLIFDIKPEEWTKNPSKKESIIKKWLKHSHEDSINEYITDYVLKNISTTRKPILTGNLFFESLSKNQEIIFICDSENNEHLLATLEISEIRKIKNLNEIPPNITWKYFLTTTSSFIIGLAETNEIVHIVDLQNFLITVKNEIGRDPVLVGDCEWFTTRSNDVLYKKVSLLPTAGENERIRNIARINWLHKASDSPTVQYSKFLMQELLERENNPFDEISLFYMQFSSDDRQLVFAQFIDNDHLIQLVRRILDFEHTDKLLTEWYKSWNISYTESYALMQLLLRISENNIHQQRILPFHQVVRESFIKSTSDKIDLIIFDIDYCKHLIICGEKKRAKELIEKRLKDIPDETLSDLLPPNDIDPTGKASGQVLRVALLELLSQTLEADKSVQVLNLITQLQPLSTERLDNLISISDSDLKNKTLLVRSLLEPESLSSPSTIFENCTYKALTSKQIENYLKHPATRKGGIFDHLQNWLANVKIPDFEVIKSYAEPVSKEKFPELVTLISDIKFALNIEGVDIFVAHGEKSVGIRSFEGQTPFLIIGGDHLNPESPYYLSFSEIKFIIGVEFAHLYYKHSRITSSDVWRGAIEKGVWVINAILVAAPVFGFIGKSLQTISKLNALSSLFQKSQQLSKVATNSKDIVHLVTMAISAIKTLSKKSFDESKEQELIAASRIMQLTADRAGLIFCDNLKSAIRAIFLSNRDLATELPVVERYGLTAYILKTNDKGDYKNRDFAIRLASLFSFYLSEDYINLRKSITT